MLSSLFRPHQKTPPANVWLLIAATLVLTGCGDVFRPVANPIIKPGGDPQALRFALVVNNNNGDIGSTTRIDVSGDTNAGNVTVGRGPVHATFNSGVARAFVADRDSDSVSFFTPTVTATNVSTISLPPGSAPVFVHSTETAFVYVATSGTNTVGVIDAGALVNTASIAVGRNPVALAETPDGKKLYCLNQADNTVSVISTVARTVTSTVAVGASPIWAVMRPDGAVLYVVNRDSGSVSVIDTSSDSVVSTLGVGSTPVHAVFNQALRRLYVANSGSNSVSVFSADVTPPTLLSTIAVGAAPLAVAALADGTRVYTANSAAGNVTVVDANGLSIRKTISVGTTPVWIDSAPDSSKVFVVNRDSNNISDIRTLDDTVVATLASGSPRPVFVVVSP